MPLIPSPLIRHLASAALAALAALTTPANAAEPAAFNARYEGKLVADSGDVSIPVSVELRDAQGILTGWVRTEQPLAGSGPVSAGDYNGGSCNLRVRLSPGTTLRMSGSCQARIFEGKYTLNSSTQGSSGSFRLEGNSGGSRQDATPINPLTACLNANTRCLVACPQGDYNAEFLCANRCRQRFQACKGKAGGGGAADPLRP
ncbi:MAG: hypothetical protein J0L85_09365 [Zoogloea sp.]|nr:hypothetical protein [Zoogloea sp.]MCA0188116.1 hypothetical protein [Pseudomonadota bacterium]